MIIHNFWLIFKSNFKFHYNLSNPAIFFVNENNDTQKTGVFFYAIEYTCFKKQCFTFIHDECTCLYIYLQCDTFPPTHVCVPPSIGLRIICLY